MKTPVFHWTLTLLCSLSFTLVACEDNEAPTPVEQEPECTEDAHCDKDFSCQEQKCVLDETPIEPECTKDAHCDKDFSCQEQKCVLDETPIEPECTEDAHCEQDFSCQEQKCVEAPLPEPVCGNGVIEAGEECDDGEESAGCTAECTAKTALFRFDTIKIIDPHLFVVPMLGCLDITHNGIFGMFEGGANGMLQTGIENTKSGQYNNSLGLLTRPLNQQKNAQTDIEFSFPKCEAPLGECSEDPNKPFIEGTITNQESGACLPTDAQLGRNPDYTGLHDPMGPCFLSNRMDIDISIRGITLALTDARVTASYNGESATHLTDGILVGFLPVSAAQDAIIPAPSPVGDTPLYDFHKGGGGCGAGSDLDTHEGQDGWWFYLNFTAERAEAWNE